MSIDKIANNFAGIEIPKAICKTASNPLVASVKNLHIGYSDKNTNILISTLDGLAQTAKAGVSINVKPCLPEYLYHMTSLNKYNEILESGEMRFSTLEKAGCGCQGIYLVDKKNFLLHWMNTGDKALVGCDMTVGNNLLGWASKGDEKMVAIKIPTRELEDSKLRFRPYIEAMKESLSSFDKNSGKSTSTLVTNGCDIGELSSYVYSSPVEYIYQQAIPARLLKEHKISSVDAEKLLDINDIKNAQKVAFELAHNLFGVE